MAAPAEAETWVALTGMALVGTWPLFSTRTLTDVVIDGSKDTLVCGVV